MRTWLITGASKGLGAALSRMVLEQGERVALCARDISVAAQMIEQFPDAALGVTLDLTKSASIQAAIEKVRDWAGSIDVLINNAGQGFHGAIEETSDDNWRSLFDVNFFGVAAIIRQVLPEMRRRGSGLIINVGSVAGFVANPGTGAYCATKFALEALTEALWKEVAPLGIKVSMVAPGGMRTGFNNASIWVADQVIDSYRSGPGVRTDELRRNAGWTGSEVV